MSAFAQLSDVMSTMTPKRVVEVCQKYAAVLDGLGAKPVRGADSPDRAGKLDHLRWMCDEIPTYLSNPQPFDTDTSIAGREKAMRWLGFMQGAMSVLEVRTVDEMKDDNR